MLEHNLQVCKRLSPISIDACVYTTYIYIRSVLNSEHLSPINIADLKNDNLPGVCVFVTASVSVSASYLWVMIQFLCWGWFDQYFCFYYISYFSTPVTIRRKRFSFLISYWMNFSLNSQITYQFILLYIVSPDVCKRRSSKLVDSHYIHKKLNYFVDESEIQHTHHFNIRNDYICKKCVDFYFTMYLGNKRLNLI